MKADRLAYLRRISETYAKTDDDEFVATGEDVLQLLDEREALQNALVNAAGYCAVVVHGEDPSKHSCEVCAEYRAALALAEAP